MALKKTTKFKGINAEYWKIFSIGFNALENKTQISMGLYLDQDARNGNVNNFLDTRTFAYSGEYNRVEAYQKIKASVLETIIVVAYQERIVDADGNVIQEEIPEQTLTNETNEFVNAEDC